MHGGELNYSAVVYLDADGRSPQPGELLPLQLRSESALQCDDEPEHFCVEGGLQPLTLGLPQEHLRGKGRGGVRREQPTRLV